MVSSEVTSSQLCLKKANRPANLPTFNCFSSEVDGLSADNSSPVTWTCCLGCCDCNCCKSVCIRPPSNKYSADTGFAEAGPSSFLDIFPDRTIAWRVILIPSMIVVRL